MSQNEEPKKSTALTVLAEVADFLEKSAEIQRERYKTLRIERELNKRVDTLDKAVAKREQLFIEVKKLRPQKMFKLNDDGTSVPVDAPVTAEEAKKFAKALKEAKEKLEKFEALLEKAFTSPDQDTFDKLAKQVAGKDTESE
jgi:hypothetical protein